MNTAGKSAAAGHKTTVTSWKPSITATACAAICPPEIITATAYDLDVQRQNMAQKEVPHMEIGGMI